MKSTYIFGKEYKNDKVFVVFPKSQKLYCKTLLQNDFIFGIFQFASKSKQIHVAVVATSTQGFFRFLNLDGSSRVSSTAHDVP